jgi:hypothetical protein
MWPFKPRYGYSRLSAATVARPNRRLLISLSKWAAGTILMAIVIFFSVCQLELNLRVYLRNWISHADESYYEPLSGCFDSLPENSSYKQGYTQYAYDVAPGISLLQDYDCYDFAATIQPRKDMQYSGEKIIYHAYWRSDLVPMGDKQLATLRSFFATQDTNSTILYLWSNGDLTDSWVVKEILKYEPNRFKTFLYDSKEVAKGSPMESSSHLDFHDDHAYLDGDLIRLLVLYKYGGMWFDMDSLFVRDMSPLFEHEWLQQWDCFLPNGFPFNGAFMRFRQNSPYVCEMLAEMANGPLPRQDNIDWGGYMYYRIYRRLLHHGIKPWAVMPWCFTDSVLCAPGNSMPNAFVEADFSTDRLLQTFAFHWHNQWNKKPGSLFRFLEGRHKNVTGW